MFPSSCSFLFGERNAQCGQLPCSMCLQNLLDSRSTRYRTETVLMASQLSSPLRIALVGMSGLGQDILDKAFSGQRAFQASLATIASKSGCARALGCRRLHRHQRRRRMDGLA